MRHRHQKHSSFGLKSGPRKSLIRGLVQSLVVHERIKTTLPRARSAQRFVEKAVTLGKKGGLPERRLLLSRLSNASAVSKIMDQLSSRFKDRAGGFTRMIKLGQRAGDQAEMVYLEFVDYDPNQALSKETKDASDVKRQSYLKKKKTKKRIRKIQQHSRRVNRPE
ncbi:MAG: 50S ribosomal protein L17 [Bdellovibrionales bacterium]|nr:50S ribosomal protein L17 [Bdellovibrionales bacterium]